MSTYTHARAQSLRSNALANDFLPGPSSSGTTSSARWIPRRLQFYLPFTVIFGTLGLIILASRVTFPAPSAPPDLVQTPAAPVPLATEVAVPLADTAPPPPEAPPVTAAEQSINELYARQSQTLEQAIARYTVRNARPPPANFDKWYNFARDKNCLVDDYDQIRRDFEPFYQLAERDPAHFQQMIDRGRELMLKDPKGMVAIQVVDGAVKMPEYTGSVFDGEWKDTLSKFAHILPDMEFLINGRDEPRVVFNTRDPAMLKDAMKLQDPEPFHLAPVPTSEFFKHRSGCSILDRGQGAVDALEDVAFIRSSSSSDFTTDLWPILSMTKISPCFADILFPGQYYYETSAWCGKFDHPNDVQWEDKKSQLYWRGQSNGGHIIHDNHHKFSRFRLVKIAQNHSDIIDAKMTGFWETHCTFDCERDPIIEEYRIGSKGSPREEIYRYKYVLDVDGNTFSGRYLGLLRSGSLVFKATAFDEYFNDWLRPYEHYIPVKIDMSDLVEKVEWAVANDKEARSIQERGTEFARRVLTDGQNDCYFGRVLLEWARVQGFAQGGGGEA
ncbi:glycosyl transferase family 90-domain-containing protein [Mycena filopes]|nr:glycosyl transferase family 90-domain-containing protein [Mycena filopes]